MSPKHTETLITQIRSGDPLDKAHVCRQLLASSGFNWLAARQFYTNNIYVRILPGSPQLYEVPEFNQNSFPMIANPAALHKMILCEAIIGPLFLYEFQAINRETLERIGD